MYNKSFYLKIVFGYLVIEFLVNEFTLMNKCENLLVFVGKKNIKYWNINCKM